jgi:hypothetical protein
MSRIKKISDRFPRWYKSEKESLILVLLQSVTDQLDTAEKEITDIMKAHWVDTAEGEDLNKLGKLVGQSRMPKEDDKHFRGYLKRVVDEYRGGGTISMIIEGLNELIDVGKGEKIEIVENPPIKTFQEFVVNANETWSLGSNSIKDEETTILIAIDGKGRVSHPQITKLDTGTSITYEGELKTEEQLILKQNRAFLDDVEVTEKVSPPETPQLSRKESIWKYSESLSESVGVFDTGLFDEHTFAVGIPNVRVRFEWTRFQPATFIVQIKKKVLIASDLSEGILRKTVDLLKAAGVKAIIKVME